MSSWTTIRRFETERFIVALQWEHERDQDLSWMDDADSRAKLASGEWTNCCFRVAVWIDGRICGTSYLGNSVYADPADFAREHLGHNHDAGKAYFPQMLREATAEARKLVYARKPTPRIRMAVQP